MSRPPNDPSYEELREMLDATLADAKRYRHAPLRVATIAALAKARDEDLARLTDDNGVTKPDHLVAGTTWGKAMEVAATALPEPEHADPSVVFENVMRSLEGIDISPEVESDIANGISAALSGDEDPAPVPDAERIAVKRSGLVALLRTVDSGGFWSAELGITYPAGSDQPVESDD